MKILMKSIYLFMFGVYIERCKRKFDRKIDRCIASGKSISSKSLTLSSDRCYYLYTKFKEAERNLNYEIRRRTALKNI